MPLSWTKIQETTVVKGLAVKGKEHPTVIFNNNGSKIVMQDGELYYEGGPKVKTHDIPAWFWTQYDKMSPKAKRFYKLKVTRDGDSERDGSVDSEGSPLDDLDGVSVG